jgi:hypothetical protein
MLKLFLFIPTTHWWNVTRLLFMCIVAAPAYRQVYLFIVDERVNRLGTQTIVLVMIAIAELALVVKMGSDFDIPTQNPRAIRGKPSIHAGAQSAHRRDRRHPQRQTRQHNAQTPQTAAQFAPRDPKGER